MLWQTIPVASCGRPFQMRAVATDKARCDVIYSCRCYLIMWSVVDIVCLGGKVSTLGIDWQLIFQLWDVCKLSHWQLLTLNPVQLTAVCGMRNESSHANDTAASNGNRTVRTSSASDTISLQNLVRLALLINWKVVFLCCTDSLRCN